MGIAALNPTRLVTSYKCPDRAAPTNYFEQFAIISARWQWRQFALVIQLHDGAWG